MNPIRDTSLKGKGPALSKHGLPPQRDCLLLTLALQKATANPACWGDKCCLRGAPVQK